MVLLYYRWIDSPVGRLKLVVHDRALLGILWELEQSHHFKNATLQYKEQHPLLCETERQLKEYFQGRRKKFDLPLEMYGTEFQRQVWNALLTIPYGETRSYRELALLINRPKAVRAVGAANGKNPISIIVPCHRVIGQSGQLTGFAGGLGSKAILLNLEKPQLSLL